MQYNSANAPQPALIGRYRITECVSALVQYNGTVYMTYDRYWYIMVLWSTCVVTNHRAGSELVSEPYLPGPRPRPRLSDSRQGDNGGPPLNSFFCQRPPSPLRNPRFLSRGLPRTPAKKRNEAPPPPPKVCCPLIPGSRGRRRRRRALGAAVG